MTTPKRPPYHEQLVVAEIERDIGSEASTRGAAMARELIEEVSRLSKENSNLREIRAEWVRAFDDGRRAERERCAKVADEAALGEDIAEKIRALPDEP
jgi:hypothetical protein